MRLVKAMTASIRTNVLPSQANAIFEDSSFFRRHPDVLLPTLSDVKAECAMQNSSALSEAMRPPPVMHESLGLVVKFGRMGQVHVSEGICLWVLRRFLPEVPVPEIYGWTSHDDCVLL